MNRYDKVEQRLDEVRAQLIEETVQPSTLTSAQLHTVLDALLEVIEYVTLREDHNPIENIFR